MRVIEIAKPNAPFELVERPTPEPGRRQVRIKVEACGVCHSDVFAATGAFPGVRYPAVPGHEVAGRIDAIGPDVTTWKVGQRVGVGWFGGECFVCDRCRRGDFITCRNLKVPSIHYETPHAEEARNAPSRRGRPRNPTRPARPVRHARAASPQTCARPRRTPA
jgi:D-arabinose 1-dehydrogenase-like Zn-dependent alcohol dehydrogenase